MIRGTLALVMMALVVAGCDKPQQLGQAPAGKADTKAWEMAQSNHVAPGWKGGDQASWEAQMRTRAQGQNEYSRTTLTAPAAAAATSAQ